MSTWHPVNEARWVQQAAWSCWKRQNLQVSAGKRTPVRNLVAISKGITRLFIDAVVRNHAHTKHWCSAYNTEEKRSFTFSRKDRFHDQSFLFFLAVSYEQPHDLSTAYFIRCIFSLVILFRSGTVARSKMPRFPQKALLCSDAPQTCKVWDPLSPR
jgi:hypothetical protein